MLRAGLPASDLANVSERRPLSAEGARLFSRHHRPHRPRTTFALPRPPRPGPALGALVRAARRPRSISLAPFLPEGVISTEPITDGFNAVYDGRWPDQLLWLCTVRLRDGQRVVFGHEGAPTALVGDAVGASCAIPAHFAPVAIGDQRYVDGGAHSMANLDVVAPLGLDLVVVSAPMGGQPAIRPDVLVRQMLRAQLEAEAQVVRAAGTPVVVLEPQRQDLTAMGLNPMDAARRDAVSRQARATVLRQVARDELGDLAHLVPPRAA
jgi:NTE family protein